MGQVAHPGRRDRPFPDTCRMDPSTIVPWLTEHWSMALTATVVAAVLALLLFVQRAPDMVMIGGVVVLLAAGVLTPDEALKGMSNEGMITVAALFVVAAAVERTGALAAIVDRVLGRPKSLGAAQLRTMVGPGVVSAFMNNTPVVALMVPAIRDWARKHRLSVSKLLMPMNAAVVLGGSRSSFLMLMVMLLCVAAMRRRLLHTVAFGSGLAVLLVLFYLVGEHAQIREVGLLRILSLASPRIAYQTDAAENMRWRMARWERAVVDIQQRPWVGKGYGGLDNAWVFLTRADFESAMVDVDVAAGSVHNGYLAAARAFGVPAVAFFLALQAWHALWNFRHSRRMRLVDPQISDLHLLVFAYVSSYTVAIYFGTDLNDPMVWFWSAFGLLVSRIKTGETSAVAPTNALRVSLAQPAPAL